MRYSLLSCLKTIESKSVNLKYMCISKILETCKMLIVVIFKWWPNNGGDFYILIYTLYVFKISAVEHVYFFIIRKWVFK